ncbi:MAG: TetR/AcrR family transcriptional regulator [Vallitaleaceae bacterium]|nr:TetR/AcrR family transcriptional regulator [Vallitaleaceae bacterium]
MQTIDQDKYTLILNAALQCFENFGYKATTVEQIAKVAKIGKGTFYNFFKTKEDVFQTIINRQLDLIKSYSQQVIESPKSDFLALNDYLYASLQCRNQQIFFEKLTMEAEVYGTQIVLDGLKQMKDAAHMSLKNILDAYVNKGLILPCDTTFLSFLMIEIYTSLSTNWTKDHAPLSNEEIIDIYAKLFRSYLPDMKRS